MKSQAGFTLVEAMVALVILAIGLTGVLGFTSTVFVQAAENDRWTEARVVAESELNRRASQSIATLQTIVATAPKEQFTVRRNANEYDVEVWYESPVPSLLFRVSIAVSYSDLPFAFPVSLSTEKNSLL